MIIFWDVATIGLTKQDDEMSIPKSKPAGGRDVANRWD